MSHNDVPNELEKLRERVAEFDSCKERCTLIESALNAQKDTFFVFEIETGRPVIWNRAFREITGYSDEEIAQRKAPDDWYDTVDLEKAFAAIEELKKVEYVTIELDLFTKNGETVPTEYTGSLIYDEDKPMYVIAIGRNITDLRETRDQLLESRRLLERALKVNNDGVFDWNLQTGEVYFDPHYYTMAGYEPNEFPGTYEEWVKRVDPAVIDGIETRLNAYLAGESHNYDEEFRFRRKDGTWMWIRARVGIFERGEDGKPLRMVGTHTDITDRKMAEESQEHLRQQLARAERMKSLGILAGGVAHDLNNVLGPMIVLPDMIVSELDSLHPEDAGQKNSIKKYLEMIEVSANRAAVVVRDLVALSRSGEYERVPVDVERLIHAVENSPSIMEIRESRPEVSIAYECTGEKMTVMASEENLVRVICNLVQNAFEALDQSGSVTVATGKRVLEERYSGYSVIPTGNYCVIEVRDTGKGIPREHIGRIFEPFYTGKKKSERSGSGLGLSVVHGIVEDHTGFIDVASEVGRGTTISIYLPLTDKPVGLFDHSEKGKVPRGDESVLVVDDEPAQRFIAKRCLNKLGYAVTEAEDGRSAVRLFSKASENQSPPPFDIVLVDMIMEDDFDGMDTLLAIRDLYPEQKIVVVSGHGEEEHLADTRKMGVPWVSKPYRVERLGLVVREQLDY